MSERFYQMSWWEFLGRFGDAMETHIDLADFLNTVITKLRRMRIAVIRTYLRTRDEIITYDYLVDEAIIDDEPYIIIQPKDKTRNETPIIIHRTTWEDLISDLEAGMMLP